MNSSAAPAPTAATVDFFFDPASPYTYLAATRMAALEQATGARVYWKPFVLGKCFEATGNRMPAAVPAKGRYLFGDLKLWAQHYGVPFRMPKIFPINSMLALRACCAVDDAQRPTLALALMQAYWSEGADIANPEVVGSIATAAGFDAAALLAATQTPEVKDRLRELTDEAIARGVFGAPTFFVGEQMFWGNDRLVLLEDYLLGRIGKAG